jgi:hypothetical protein
MHHILGLRQEISVSLFEQSKEHINPIPLTILLYMIAGVDRTILMEAVCCSLSTLDFGN